MTSTYPDHLVASPGEVLEDWLDEKGMSQRELADRTSKSEKFVSQLINGKVSLTADTAHDLELVTGVGAATWLRMEGSYQAAKRRQAAIAAATYPLSPIEKTVTAFLRKQRIISAPARATGEQRMELFALLGVNSATGLERLATRRAAAFRVSAAYVPEPLATEVLIALAYREAELIDVDAFDPNALRGLLPELRACTQLSPSEGAERARARLAHAGVALVFLPNVPKAHCNGVTLWNAHGPVVAITDRGRREDIFWFTLFHELAHVLDEHRSDIYLEGPGGGKTVAERRADAFATESLIPRDQEHLLEEIVSFGDLERVANALGVGEGVVIGQLHYRGLKKPAWGQARLARVAVQEG